MIEAGSAPARMRGARSRPRPAALGGLLVLPAALLLQRFAFEVPDFVESAYSRGLYPRVAGTLGWINAWFPLSLAEVGVVALFGWLAWRLVRRRRQGDATEEIRRSWSERSLAVAGRLVRRSWIVAGWGLLGFLLLWGFNYARPPLAIRMQLDTAAIEAPEVLELARRAVEAANLDHASLGIPSDSPSQMPLALRELNTAIDASYRNLRLPGDELGNLASRAKPLMSSTIFSYLGISGIYIPFTGEPSFNRLVPDASLPIAVAHEMAHQRGITDEGEANLAAAIACARADRPYLRYAAHLYMATALISGAGRYLPDDATEVWESLGDGPRAEMRAIREFWDGYRGRATRVAARVNDAYLRSNRVPGGVQSYGRVVSLLVGLDRRGEVLPALTRISQ